ncbi:MAG: benzoate-CoA ligase family protein [Alphaproteobacteria bacterium]|nr:benzoate-CoA ligase family protein [Alphaproteobacteria bacterium]
MRDNTVVVDRAGNGAGRPTRLDFAARFNVAVPFIDRHVEERRGGKVAIRAGDEAVTYAELAERVARCGNALLGLGLKRGDRALMVVKDAPEFFYLFWGAIKAGIVPVPLNTLLRADDYRYLIEDSACAALIYSPEFATEVEAALEAAARRPDHALRVEGEGQTLRALIAMAPAALEAAPSTATDDCFWLYSSGSTGKPKGAVHAHRDMVVTSQHYGVETLGVTAEDVCFSAAKLFFAYGLGNAMTFPLWVGGSAVLLGARPTPQLTFDVIQRYRPTLYFGVPTLYAAQLQAMEQAKPDLSSLRLCVSAGEALPGHIFARWTERTGVPILDGIGSTEALHIFISNRTNDIKPGASGRVVTGYDARIVDEAGHAVKPGESGRLLIRGDSTAGRYWNNAERTKRTMVGGWLDTGDTYMQDGDGHFIYCGRNDDMLKVGGQWCSPFEIEAKLGEHARVLEAAVVGRGDADGLIKPEAWVVLKEQAADTKAIEDELVQLCKSGLAHYKYPRWFRFVGELPKTATGKIQRFKLRQG